MTNAVDRAAEAIVRHLQADPVERQAGAVRRAIGCSPDTWSKAVQRLRWQGKLEFGTLTLTPSLRVSVATGAEPGAGPEGDAAAAADASPAAGGAARFPLDAPLAVRPTGPDLVGELEQAAAAAGVGLRSFVARICSSNGAAKYVEQLRAAKWPKASTIEKVRALIAGELPDLGTEVEVRGGCPGSGNTEMRRRALAFQMDARAKEESRHHASDLARQLRQPGETLHEAVQREALDDVLTRKIARRAGGGVEPIDLAKRIAHFPKARKFEPLPPDIWARLKALAEEQGEAPMALLPRVVERGLQSFGFEQ